VQLPFAPFAGAALASHGFGRHVAAVSVPREHELVPETVYPALHVGRHEAPDASAAVQLPFAPFAGAALASHGFGRHVAAVSVPREHELVPETVYPALHVGRHEAPDASAAVQLPFAPFAGAALASHGFAVHEVLLNVFVVRFSVGMPV
jgi:hypothetical protein